MNSTPLLLLIIGVIVLASLFSSFSSPQTGSITVSDPSPLPSVAGTTVRIGERNYNYYFPESGSSTITLKKGQPVTFEAIMSGNDKLVGCSKALSTPWGSTVFTSSDTTFTFTPQREGTYSFSCSMGMVPGTIVVEA